MPLAIIKDNIITMAVDAIVNPTDRHLSGGGSLDGRIHAAAGVDMDIATAMLGGCKVGNAVITRGYDLKAKYVIHAVGPRWKDGKSNEDELLASCYRNALEIARDYKCKSIAFPLISGGNFGFPNDDVLRIAKKEIETFLEDNDMEVYIVAYHRNTFNLGAKLFAEVSSYVDRNYMELVPEKEAVLCAPICLGAESLEDMLKERSETFSCMLLRLIGESGMTNAQCYNKARINRTVFSRIRNNINYRTTKLTAVAFAIALELPWEKLEELVESAGFKMTHNDKFDIVIEYFVKNGRYNIDEINEALYEIDAELPLIGC